MSNYKWVKESEKYVDLRTEEFRSTSFLSLPLAVLNPLLLNKLSENGIGYDFEGDTVELFAIDREIVTITAPLYEFKLDTGKFELLEESYTNTSIDPTKYEWVEETYLQIFLRNQARFIAYIFLKATSKYVKEIFHIHVLHMKLYLSKKWMPKGKHLRLKFQIYIRDLLSAKVAKTSKKLLR